MVKRMVSKIGSWVNFVITQKFRLDMVASFLTYVNFALLVITSSDKVQYAIVNVLGWNLNDFQVIILMMALIGGLAILFGYFLDSQVKYWQHMQSIQNERNPQIVEILANTRELKAEIEQLRTKLRTYDDKDSSTHPNK